MTGTRWTATPIKYLVSVNDDVLPESYSPEARIHYIEISDVSEGVGISWHEAIKFADAPSRARRRVRDGDVLVSTVRTYLRAVTGVHAAPADAIASTGFAVLRPREANSRFLEYAMLNSEVLHEVVARSVGVSYPAINSSDLVSIKIPVPDPSVQTAVAKYLDRETAEIDAFIADQEELVGLLLERRAVSKAQHFASIVHIGFRSGTTPLAVAISEVDTRVGGGELELLSVSIHRGLLPWGEMHDREPSSQNFRNYKVVEPGQIVLNRMRAFQGAAGVAGQKGMVSPDYAVFRVAPASEPAYMGELLRSPVMSEAIKLRLRGIGDTETGAVRTPRVNVNDLVRIKVDLPNRVEQARLLSLWAVETAELDAAIADARGAISLSRERRAALISTVVTGKIDVREHGLEG